MIVEEEDKEGLYTRVEKKQRVRKLIRKNPCQNPVSLRLVWVQRNHKHFFKLKNIKNKINKNILPKKSNTKLQQIY